MKNCHLIKSYLVFVEIDFMEYSHAYSFITTDERRVTKAYKDYKYTYNGYNTKYTVVDLQRRISLKEAVEEIEIIQARLSAEVAIGIAEENNNNDYALAFIHENINNDKDYHSFFIDLEDITHLNISEIKEKLAENAQCYVIKKDWILSEDSLKEMSEKFPDIKSNQEIADELVKEFEEAK